VILFSIKQVFNLLKLLKTQLEKRTKFSLTDTLIFCYSKRQSLFSIFAFAMQKLADKKRRNYERKNIFDELAS